jgi:hypothetical protein
MLSSDRHGGYVTPVRWSGRFGVDTDGGTVTDEDSMQKAMRRKAAQNLDYAGMMSSHKSKFFLLFSSPDISSKLNSLGVSLGSTDKEIAVSTRVLKHMEFDCLTVIPKASTMLDSTYLDEEAAISTLDGQLLSHLVGEVSEVGLDDDDLYSLYELNASRQKSKSSSNKKPQKRSKISKSPMFPNEWHLCE